MDNAVGETIPPMTAHAVSVSLPTWKANVGYEGGEEWVVSKMKSGYPRFFIHKSIRRLAEAVIKMYGHSGEDATLFPSKAIAARCQAFISQHAPGTKFNQARIIELAPRGNDQTCGPDIGLARTCAVLFPKELFKTAKAFWQHSGDGLSSRRAEYCYTLLEEGKLGRSTASLELGRSCKGPRRYQKKGSIDGSVHSAATLPGSLSSRPVEIHDTSQFVEERFGRNLDLSLAASAKVAIRRRIAGSLTADVGLAEALSLDRDTERTRQVAGFSEDDVYLYPSGMSSIFNTHRTLLAARGSMRSICYGFPYLDTLKILEKFGPGCQFYGFASAEELDDLERRLREGERFLALFCEFPGNPLLKSPDLRRIRELADKYGFAVVIDETIGNFLNVNVLPYADVVVSSLTKIFSGDCNVMGGSAILNPKGQHYDLLKRAWMSEFEDNVWPEDAVFLERNSRDFVSRIERVNANAEAICDIMRAHPRVKQVYYPKHSASRPYYDQCRTASGGYGGLLSATFHHSPDAIVFYDHLETAKGPSLGTNFTLSSPFVVLAHYTELDWAASYGLEANLVRFSVGLEETQELVDTFRRALDAIASRK